MMLLRKKDTRKLLANSAESAATEGGVDHFPVVKLFNPCGAATFLISEMDENDIMFGLADLGFGCPEMGDISLAELKEIKLPFGLSMERDTSFKGTKPLGEYANDARDAGSIRV